MMDLTHYVVIKPKYIGYELIEPTSKEAARCWNIIIKIANNYYKKHKKWISNYSIQKILDKSTNFNLHAHTIDGISDKYCANRLGIAQARKSNYKDAKKLKYPYKEKEYFCIPFKKAAFKRIGDTLRLSMGNGRYLYIDFDCSYIDVPSYGEIVYKDGQYRFYYVLKVKEYDSQSTGVKCGVDLGEIHSITATTTEGKSVIITNRKGKSIKHYRNKQLHELTKKIKRCKQSSNRYKKLVKAKNVLMNKTKNQLKNLYHNTTSKFMDFCIQNKVDEIIVGACSGVGQNTKNGSKKRRKRKSVRTRLSQFETGTLQQYLSYKSKLNGIKCTIITEEYTSQLCPICGNKHKVSGRTYKCPNCGYINHRDVNGAWNILTKQYREYQLPNEFKVIYIKPINY